MKWLFRIFMVLYGCRHRWQIVDAHKTFESETDKMPVGIVRILQCKRCGNLKKVKV